MLQVKQNIGKRLRRKHLWKTIYSETENAMGHLHAVIYKLRHILYLLVILYSIHNLNWNFLYYAYINALPKGPKAMYEIPRHYTQSLGNVNNSTTLQ